MIFIWMKLRNVIYIEKAGTGTTDMITDCLEAKLPEPEFEQHGSHFVVTLWRDWLTDKVMADLGLNDRQKKAIVYLKKTEVLRIASIKKLQKPTKKWLRVILME